MNLRRSSSSPASGKRRRSSASIRERVACTSSHVSLRRFQTGVRRVNSNSACCASGEVSGEMGSISFIFVRVNPGPKFKFRLFLQKLAGDDEFLDLGGAFVDAQGAHVAVEAFDCLSADEADAAVYL